MAAALSEKLPCGLSTHQTSLCWALLGQMTGSLWEMLYLVYALSLHQQGGQRSRYSSQQPPQNAPGPCKSLSACRLPSKVLLWHVPVFSAGCTLRPLIDWAHGRITCRCPTRHQGLVHMCERLFQTLLGLEGDPVANPKPGSCRQLQDGSDARKAKQAQTFAAT